MVRSAALVAALLLTLGATRPLRAQDAAGIIPDDVERRLDGFYMFSTDGGGRYEIYQRLDSRKGLTEADPVLCLINLCYLRVGEVAAAQLTARAGVVAGLESVRRPFRAARDAYLALLRSDPAGLAPARAAWRAANADILACLEREDAC